ncbi:N-acetyldiaminopimelate deacetylase [Fructobacillus ficulneus]|uniref:N-acetyldiaminopimelate deacetylase n=1 Tax=Fructobacillus ficulneus TaxID=157463 RepID=A0A0K8MJX7_9LACO|nr:N-acetyldiaminopimelate deacetylase [Fructobacillus ficulneus]GAP00180.1 N-acetyldiaminopimelate deacetylase [Fructobacillus ficulneus]
MANNSIDLIQVRRDLHKIPELALEEFETQAYLKSLITSLDCPFLTIKEVPEVPTAMLVRLAGSQPSKTIGYRTDIDGLPVEEATGLAWSSTHPGKMHACGHDIHMTVAMGILAYFANHQPKDNLVFIFQPAEEAKAGGKQIYDAGALTGDFAPDEIYALHDQPAMPAGQLGSRFGTLLAGTTEIKLTITGVSGHAAYPHQAKDALVAAAAFVTQVQTVVSRNVSPIHGGVVTLGSMHAGIADNVIPGEAQILGTIRAFTQTDLEMMQNRVRAVAEGVGLTYGVEIDLVLHQGGYYPVENNPEITTAFIDFMNDNPAIDFVDVEPSMAGEDFGYLLSKFPGTMFWLGVGDPTHSLHNAGMNPNEDALQPGVDAMTAYLEWRMDPQAQGKGTAS